MHIRYKTALPLLILLTLLTRSSSFFDDILRKKIAQMFILGFSGTTMSQWLRSSGFTTDFAPVVDVNVNPQSPATVLRYDLLQKSSVHLVVYNILGQLVATLADGVADSGTHEIRFDGNDRATGVYLARLDVRPLDGRGEYTLTSKLILIR